MQYRPFGNTGLNISALGFGAMRLPECRVNGKQVFDVEESIRIIRRAVELGVNYVDTAPYYCDSESEVIVGKALKGLRDKVYLSTKNPIENSSGSDWRKRLESSLKKLDVDYIDFYHMWGIGLDAYRNEIDVADGPMQAAQKAKEEGLIRHISFSFHDDSSNLIPIIDTGNFDSMLVQYNLLDRSNEDAIAHAKSKGLGVVVMGPVGGGRLGTPSDAILRLLPGKVSSSAQLALRFVLGNTGVHCALSGMSSMAMVEENCAIASNEAPLSYDEMLKVNESVEENRKMAELYCTGCNYCMPCPHGVNIPENFRLYNQAYLYDDMPSSKKGYKRLAEKLEIGRASCRERV